MMLHAQFSLPHTGKQLEKNEHNVKNCVSCRLEKTRGIVICCVSHYPYSIKHKRITRQYCTCEGKTNNLIFKIEGNEGSNLFLEYPISNQWTKNLIT